MKEIVSRKFTKEEILAAITECAAKLGHVPTFLELQRTMNLKACQITRHFHNYTKALKICGLEREGCGVRVTMDGLFHDWARLVRELRKVPTVQEYEEMSKYSQNPLRHRFGSWHLIPGGMMQYAREHSLEQQFADVLEIADKRFQQTPKRALRAPLPAQLPVISKARPDRPLCGAPLIAPALGFAPINENGVMFLFGSMARELGFIVTHIGPQFPDIEAFREVEPGRWQLIRIELEFLSRNFLHHFHDPKQCDLIVCWEHNWPECPIEVIALKDCMAGLMEKIG